MTAFYKELQPADGFRIRLPFPFSDYDRQLLTLLYQPMIGSEAVSLYLTLWAEGETLSTETPHYTLMNILGMPISKIFESRIQLEAIGLMKTYRKGSDSRTFLYELSPPLDPKDFFADPLLSMFLFSKIGDIAYRRVRDRFIVPTEDMADFEDVTRIFTDVFQPVHAKAGYPTDSQKMQQRSRKGYKAEYDFDFSLLHQGLSEQLVPKRVLTAPIKDTICKLAFLYGWGPLEMQKVILLAIDDDYRLTIEGIKKSAAEYYKMTVATTAPKLEPVHINVSESKEEEPKTRQDELVLYLESASPIDVLRDIAGGKEPLSADVQLANNLVIQHGMEPAVVNVLLQYVLLRTDMKLTKSYVEKIASHWIRKKVSTAAEAMELARTEHAQYMKWKAEGSPAAVSKPSTRSAGKPVREEKLPEWFYTKDEQPKASTQKNESLEIEKQKLLAKLALKKGKGE